MTTRLDIRTDTPSSPHKTIPCNDQGRQSPEQLPLHGLGVVGAPRGVASARPARHDGLVEENRSAPWARIVPVIRVRDVRDAVEWYCSVFGLVEHVRIGDSHRAQLGVSGDRAELVVAEERDDSGKVEVMIKVEDVDAVLTAARKAGADVAAESHDWEYGERQGALVDPFGQTWGSPRRCANRPHRLGRAHRGTAQPRWVDRGPHGLLIIRKYQLPVSVTELVGTGGIELEVDPETVR